MQRSQCSHRSVHAGEAVRTSVEALHKRQESLRPAPPRVASPPCDWCGHWHQSKKCHLKSQQKDITERDVQKVPRGSNGPVNRHDHRIIKKTVNPHPAWPVWNEIIDG